MKYLHVQYIGTLLKNIQSSHDSFIPFYIQNHQPTFYKGNFTIAHYPINDFPKEVVPF